jgi:hypothetical protein
MFELPIRLAALVAAIVPPATGHRATRPSRTRMHKDTPAAGQKTATPSGSVKQKQAQACREEMDNAHRNSKCDCSAPPLNRTDVRDCVVLWLFPYNMSLCSTKLIHLSIKHTASARINASMLMRRLPSDRAVLAACLLWAVRSRNRSPQTDAPQSNA